MKKKIFWVKGHNLIDSAMRESGYHNGTPIPVGEGWTLVVEKSSKKIIGTYIMMIVLKLLLLKQKERF